MLSIDERAELIALAMKAAQECYDIHFMDEVSARLTDLGEKHGNNILWRFLINATPITRRLYLEFCLIGTPAFSKNISFRI